MILTLMINGDPVPYHGDPRRSLLEVLREDLHLTGTKDVCGEGFCGACTVQIDGVPKVSCLLPVGSLAGAEITTIEGVSNSETLTAVQKAFLEYDVVQCGMCFPGMVLSMTHFMAENPSPTRAELKSAMTGNICRCTGYERIIDALMSLGADGFGSADEVCP